MREFRKVLHEASNRDLLEIMAKCGEVVDNLETSYHVKRAFYKLAKLAEKEHDYRMSKED